MRASMANVHVALYGEIRRPPPLSHDPPVPLYADAFLTILPFYHLLTHTSMYCDAICETWRVHDLRNTCPVHMYTKRLNLIYKLCIIIYIKISSSY